MNKIVVMFPESQMLDTKEGFLDNCELINSEVGIEMYGACAYLVNEDWYNKFKNGKLADANYTEEDMENMIINWSFPIESDDDF